MKRIAASFSFWIRAFISGVCCTGVWPNGPQERAPWPCGQTRDRAISAAATSPISGMKMRSGMARL